MFYEYLDFINKELDNIRDEGEVDLNDRKKALRNFGKLVDGQYERF